MIIMIAAAAENNALGKDNDLMWHLPDDFKRFKQLTSGHYIIMGRKTFESFPKPLPNRTHIIITRQKEYHPEGTLVVNSIEKAFDIILANHLLNLELNLEEKKSLKNWSKIIDEQIKDKLDLLKKNISHQEKFSGILNTIIENLKLDEKLSPNENESDNEEIWKIVKFQGKIYFQSFNELFVYDGKNIEKIKMKQCANFI